VYYIVVRGSLDRGCEPSKAFHGDLVGDGTGLVATWESLAERNVSSWRKSGLDGDRAYFYATVPATAGVAINLGEVLVHSWDLAQANHRTDARLARTYAMTSIAQPRAALARAARAESLHAGPSSIRLLLDSSNTGGALSAHRAVLGEGVPGASPHLHGGSSELFYVIDGSADLLAGDELVTAGPGDLLVVPPGVAHAFRATAGHTAEMLIVVTPGIERFDFFRSLVAFAHGELDRDTFLSDQARFDTYPASSAAWDETR
jgi:mannose-6-phosphate isomerase-like protein (cupin superfamily)